MYLKLFRFPYVGFGPSIWRPITFYFIGVSPIGFNFSVSFYSSGIRVGVICVSFYLRIPVWCNDYLRIVIGPNVWSVCVRPIWSVCWFINRSCNYNVCCVVFHSNNTTHCSIPSTGLLGGRLPKRGILLRLNTLNLLNSRSHNSLLKITLSIQSLPRCIPCKGNWCSS